MQIKYHASLVILHQNLTCCFYKFELKYAMLDQYTQFLHALLKPGFEFFIFRLAVTPIFYDQPTFYRMI